MGLKITTTKHENTPIVKLVGRMIGVDDRKFQKKMESLYKKSDRIVVDVSDTDFIDSHGVGIIVYYHTLMQKANKQLVLLNQNPNPVAYMTRLLEMTNLNKVLNVMTSIESLQ